MFKMNKFYVGSREIARCIENNRNSEWTSPSIEHAIKHAQETMEENDSDCAIVVQIIRIVRRAKPPVVIEKVK